MNEDGFRKFLKDRYQGTTPRTYFEITKNFAGWLFEQSKRDIDDVDESDIRSWASYVQKEHPKCRPYLYGVRAYYWYKRKDKIANLITKIVRKLPPSPETQPIFIRWTDFKKMIEKVEETRIPAKYRVLLNLLWSEMENEEILNLYVSDIDFENRLITSPTSEKTFHVTCKAWDALEKYIPVYKREKEEPLFSKIGLRSLYHNTKKYLRGSGQTPDKLRKSCKNDLLDAGRTIRFRFAAEPDGESISRIEHEQIEESVSSKGLFDRLVEEIRNFGNRMHQRIKQVKDEKEFKRLFEGYLLATFPDEIIIPEFHFKGIENADSIIDFAIGKDQKIPIEVKLAEKRIRDHIGKGIWQVKEFLKSYASDKGILVVGDKERDPERRKHSGMQDNVYIIVI
jgi:integrase